MGFLPKDYEVPQSSNYMKFIQGKNRFRVLGEAIIGNEFWRRKGEGREPVRRRTDEPILASELEVDPKTGKSEPIKHFWAFPVWNYAAKCVQVLEVTQKTIMQAIQALADEPDWGDPMNYDLIVTKVGSGFETEYSTQPAPAKPISIEIELARDATPVDLEQLFVNGDPFATAPQHKPTINRTTAPAQSQPSGNGADRMVVNAAREKAWAAFTAPLEFKGKSESEREAWRKLLRRVVPGKPSNEFTVSEWNQVLLQINEPAGAEVLGGPGVPIDEIPFGPNVM